MKRIAAFLVIAVASINAHSQEKMREFHTDRPDRTEGPFTVDKGHFQFETDVVNFKQDKTDVPGSGEPKASETNLLTTDLKFGVTDSIDLEAIVAPQVTQASELAGNSQTQSGFGDTVLRMKVNFLGNDEGPVALGLIPYVQLPTSTNDVGSKVVEGGLIFPVALQLPQEWNMGMMLELDRAKNDANDNLHSEFVSSMTLGHAIVGELDGYVEFYSKSSESAAWEATYDAGLVYKVTPDSEVDIGANIGATKAAPDVNPFIGLSARY